MIEVQNVSKRYFGVPVIEDVSFTAEPGKVLGLIGYNGAGKTTLLKVIAGVCKPESGRALLGGEPVWENTTRKAEAFLLAEDLFFLPGATIRGMRDFYAGYIPSWDDALYGRLCAAFRLPPAVRIEGFSRGMRRQAGIAICFSARPKYLLLDEVFDGLDLAMRRVTATLLEEYVKKTGAAAIVASHNLRELEDRIDCLAMIRQKKLAFAGTMESIRQSHGTLEEYFLDEREADESAFAGIFV